MDLAPRVSETPSLVPPEFDNRIAIQKLEVVCLVVELGSVERAAERLSVPAQVVTAHLRSLEERFRITLFARTGRTLQVTEEGQRVYEFAAQTLARGRAMIRELQSLEDGDRGAAVIGAGMSIGSYLLPSILVSFRRSRPHAEITLTSGDPGSALWGVRQGALDFAIVVLDAPPEDPALVHELMGEAEFVLVTAPDGPPTSPEISVSDLGRLPIITAPRGSGRRGLIDRLLGRYTTTLQAPVLEIGHPQAVKRAVIQGMGATLMSRMAVERELSQGVIREVPIVDVHLTVPIYAVMRVDKVLSKLQGQLLSAIRDELRNSSPIA